MVIPLGVLVEVLVQIGNGMRKGQTDVGEPSI